MTEFVAGAIMMTYATIGLFFWRFWRKSGDRLYVMFATAFWILAVNRMMLQTSVTAETEGLPIYYVVRMAAFLLIIVAVVDKNYSR